MSYQEIFQEENEEVEERYLLMQERIEDIVAETEGAEGIDDYFHRMGEFVLLVQKTFALVASGEFRTYELKQLQEWNHRLYEDILPDHYSHSYANPTYAVKQLGREYGSLLCFLYTELRSMIPYAFEERKYHMTILCELFVEIYSCFQQKEGATAKEIEHIIYWFFHDYTEIFAEDKARDMVDADYDFFTKIVCESDLSDVRYLYYYGEYISDTELASAAFLNQLSEEEIVLMADTMTEGYRIGFETTGKDLSIKETVCLEYPIGFERVAKAAIENFKKMGLKTTMFRNPTSSYSRLSSGKRGVYASSANKQYEFDHKADRAFYMDKAYVERRLETTRAAYEKYKIKARKHAGPAVIEIFGEKPFQPAVKKEAKQYSKEQNELNVYQMSRQGQIINEYIPGEERSFTIIAYPVVDIGKDYEAIFRETVKLNTLNYKEYQRMQQQIIDVLDTAERVHIKGKGDNCTDLWVQIHPLADRSKQTAFENCVADVNIPVGEVFTSPVLKGTNGVLHVSRVYLNELSYTNLKVTFEDGMITNYSCDNFDTEEENQKYIFENVLFMHKTLPMGEFAIGTNTTAYRMAKDYDIADRLPILIAEKTGPHFAVGDTCYSHAEDTVVYNPDGKEIVARDNEISILRKEDIEQAYFNCHTDITIPFEELDSIVAVSASGEEQAVILDGRFVVEGTEKLNVPLER